MPRYPQAILVSCEVPWDEHERLLEDVFRREVRHVLALGFTHLYVFGTAGEGYAVDTARFRQIVQLFYEETRAAGLHPMVGVIGLSTANVVERLAIAYQTGFRSFQISLPAWGMLNDAEVLVYFRDVCGAFPDCQFLHYNLARTKRLLTGRDYRRVIDEVPNLVATKNTGGGGIGAADLMRHAPELQHFLGEANFVAGCQYGECSMLGTWALTTPSKSKAYFEAGRAGDLTTAARLEHGFVEILSDFLETLPQKGLIDGAYDKVLLRLGGFEEMPLHMLSPYGGFSEAEYQSCKQALLAKHAGWLAQ